MKRKIIFLLFETGIIFMAVADFFKLLLCEEEWLIASVLSCICSFVGGVFCECLSRMKNGKKEGNIIEFESQNKNIISKQTEVLIVTTIVLAIVLVFIEGVIMDRPSFLHTVLAISSFDIGYILYEEMLQKMK